MLNKTLIALLCLALAFCTTPAIEKQPNFSQLDSLLSFDSIVAIYTHGTTPPTMIDDALKEGESRSNLHIDSVQRWTSSPEIIRRFKKIFPRLNSRPSFIEFTCCGHRELLVETSKNTFRFSWNVNTSDSAIMFDTIAFKGEKQIFNKLSQLPERKIICKEILSKDSLYYKVYDVYTSTYVVKKSHTQFVYLLQ